jgi:hypothetical protein
VWCSCVLRLIVLAGCTAVGEVERVDAVSPIVESALSEQLEGIEEDQEGGLCVCVCVCVCVSECLFVYICLFVCLMV